MIFALYRGLTVAAAPLVSLLLRRRLAHGKEDPARLHERMGRPALPRPPGPLVWLHAASIGESVSALPVIERVSVEGGVTVLVTTGTVTSARMLAERLPAGALHQFSPIDLPANVKRFLDHWRLVNGPDVAEGDAADGWRLLFELEERVPVVEEEVFEFVVVVFAAGAVCAPEAEEGEGLAACADAGVENVGVAQSEVARVESFLRPAGADDVRNAGGENAVLDEDVVDIVAGTRQIGVGVAVPVALHGEDVIGGAEKAVADDSVAAAEPVHAVLIGVAGVAADDAEVVVSEIF